MPHLQWFAPLDGKRLAVFAPENGALTLREESTSIQARGKSRASTETDESPGRQGARRENIGYIRPTSNAVSRDESSVECRGTFATGC